MTTILRSIAISAVMLFMLSLSQLISQPAYQTGAWVKTGGPIGGLGYDIRHSFENHDRWYVTDAFGGIFLSENRGLTWTESNEGILTRKGLDGIPVFCVVVDPHNSNRIWVGTEATGKVYKSENGGDTWEEKSNGITDTLFPLTFRGVTIDPVSPEIMFAMAEIGSVAWHPSGEAVTGIEMDLTKGIIYKSTDGGENWREVWMGNNLARYCQINPQNTQEIYVSTGIYDREAANTDVEKGIAGGVGILKSEDGGETWRVLNESNGLKDLYLGSLFMHPEHPDTLLAAAGQNNWSAYGEEFTGGIYLTTDGGENWHKQTDEAELFSAVEYCTCNPDIAYAASDQAVYRSDDTGFTWQRFSRPNNTWGPPGIIAGFPIDLLCDPDDPLRIMVNGYLGGNFLSVDGGQTWLSASDGYTGSLIRGLAVSQTDPAVIYAGSRSGIYYSGNGGGNWYGMANPPVTLPAKFNEITSIVVNPFDDKSLRTVALDNPVVLYSYDGGSSWHHTETFARLNELKFFPGDSSIMFGAAWDVHLATIPEDIPPDEALDSLMGLYSSLDAGLHWSKIEIDVANSKCITSFEVDPNNPDVIYLSKCDGTMLKTYDGGLTWNTIGTGLPGIPALSLEISKTNPDLLYAGVGYLIPLMGDGLYKSEDGGNTWNKLSTGLEANSSIRSIAIDPVNENIVYVADYLSGVSVTENGGETWFELNEGIDHREAMVLELSAGGDVLYMGAEGGGVYRLGEVPVSPTHISINKQGNDRIEIENIFPTPFTKTSTLNFTVLNPADLQISVFNISGQLIKTLTSHTYDPGHYSVTWDGTNDSGVFVSSGLYLLNIKAGNKTQSVKISYVK